MPNDEPQSVSPGIGRPRSYAPAPAHQYEPKATCRERKETAPTMYDNLANIKNTARMNGNTMKAKEPASRFPTSSSTVSSSSTSSSTSSTYVDPVGNNLNVLNRCALYRKNITSKCNDVCDLTRYSSKCDNYFIVPDSFELLKDFNISETHHDNYNYSSSNSINNNSSTYNNNTSSINSNYAPRRIRISTAAVSKSYSRIKNPRRKRRGLSYYIIRGVSLDSIPENRELVEFNEYIQIKMKRSSHTTSDSNSMKQHLK